MTNPGIIETSREFIKIDDLVHSNLMSMQARNGRIWMTTKTRQILYISRVGNQVIQKIVPRTEFCLFIYVSACGRFCCYRTNDKKAYVINEEKLEPEEIKLMENASVVSASWLVCKGKDKPILFLASDSHFIFSVDMNLSRIKVNVLCLPSKKNENVVTKAINTVQLNNGEIGLSRICSNQIIPYVFTKDFFSKEKANTSINLPLISKLSNIYIDSQTIGVYIENEKANENASIMGVNINLNADIPNKLLNHQFFLSVPRKTTAYYLADGLAITYSDCIHIYIIKTDNSGLEELKEIGTIPATGFNLDFDRATKQFVLLQEHGIEIISFKSSNQEPPRQAFYRWAYSTLSSYDQKEAAYQAFLKTGFPPNYLISPLPVPERLPIVKKLLEQTDTQLQLRRALAYMGAELSIREMAQLTSSIKKGNSDDVKGKIDEDRIKSEVSFLKCLMNDFLLSENAVSDLLDLYGLHGYHEEIFGRDNAKLLENCLAHGEFSRAIELMHDLKDNEDFKKLAVRVFEWAKTEVAEETVKRGLKGKEMITILLRPECAKIFESLYENKKLTGWQTNILILNMMRSPTEEAVKDFCGSSAIGIEEKRFLIRCLSANSEHKLTAIGLTAMKEWSAAAREAAFAGNEEVLRVLQATPENASKEASRAALMALGREGAGKLASFLMQSEFCAGLDTATLLKYLPDVRVEEVEPTIDADIIHKYGRQRNEERQMNEITSSVKAANALIAGDTRDGYDFFVIERCAICDLPLMAEPFITFPCGHGCHKRCAEKLQRDLGKGRSPDDDCPLCGFTAVDLLDVPFETESDLRFWSMDLSLLCTNAGM